MQRLFYATAEDLLPLFDHVEKKHALAYTLTGLHRSEVLQTVYAGKDLPSLYLPAPGESAVYCPKYLVTPAAATIAIRAIEQHGGGIRHAVDQLMNADSVVFEHGGFYKPNVLLYGRVATVSNTDFAKQLYRAFDYVIRKRFTRIQAFHVGSQAKTLWEQGCRLTAANQSPPEFDLPRS